DAVERRLRARHAQHGAPGVDLALASEGRDRLREREPALLRAVRARQRHRPRAPDRHLEEPLAQMREGHLVLVDVDAEPVDEVGTAQALRQLAQGPETGSPPPAVPRGTMPCHGARSIQSRVTGFSPTPESSRFMTAAMVERLSGLLMSARASTSPICRSPASTH